MQFHPNFPLGKGMWIWKIPECEGGNIQKIIAKCKAFDISNVLIKSANGSNCYPSNNSPQLTKEIVDAFHANEIKVFSWSYIYGADPAREAALVLWSLEQLGVDGHVFDPEIEYQNLANNDIAAEIMFQRIRASHPNDFLAYAPFPIIDLHTPFCYKVFGKYCDAVMPQMYWGTMGYTPLGIINKVYEQWSKWQKIWTDEGNPESVKPIIPLGQAYDNPETSYVLTPGDLSDFITTAAGYGAVNFWEWSHTFRQDCWQAIRDGKVKDLSALLGRPKPTLDSISAPAVTPQAAGTQASDQTISPAQPASNTVAAETKPEAVPAPGGDLAPADKRVVFTPQPNSTDTNTDTTVGQNEDKVLIDYIIEFFTRIFHRGGGKK